MLLVFAHLLAASMALGAIVATDLRLLSKLSQDRLRIAPPNEFVARIVLVALLILYLTGGALVALGSLERADFLSNPKLQAKILLVVLLTLNAFVLHRLTFPRLARGRRVARWHAADWILVAVPVAVSNFLWMFVAFLGVARPWNYSMPLRDILEVAAALYIVAQVGVFAVLAMAGRNVEPEQKGVGNAVRRSLASLGSLGTPIAPAERSSRRRSRPGRSSDALVTDAAPAVVAADANADAEPNPMTASMSGRPSLRLVGHPEPAGTPRRRSR